jgi:hypothetical protein
MTIETIRFKKTLSLETIRRKTKHVYDPVGFAQTYVTRLKNAVGSCIHSFR